MRWIFALALLPLPAFACPPAKDVSEALDAAISEARAAEDEAAGRTASDKMWELWLLAPDEAAQEVLDAGMRKRGHYDYAGALEEFDRLVDYCPDYPEGYNQRAFVRYLRGEFEVALVDLDRTLEMIPNHVGAQSGRALTLMQLGRMTEARQQMLAALENNPWLSERALVAKNAPLGPVGEDI